MVSLLWHTPSCEQRVSVNARRVFGTFLGRIFPNHIYVHSLYNLNALPVSSYVGNSLLLGWTYQKVVYSELCASLIRARKWIFIPLLEDLKGNKAALLTYYTVCISHARYSMLWVTCPRWMDVWSSSFRHTHMHLYIANLFRSLKSETWCVLSLLVWAYSNNKLWYQDRRHTGRPASGEHQASMRRWKHNIRSNVPQP